MKRIALFSLALMLLLSLWVLPISAEDAPETSMDMVEPAGDVYVPRVTTPPTLDGILSDGEWKENTAFVLSDWNMKAVVTAGFVEVTPGWQGVYRFAWDDDYLYFAHEITDPTLTARIDGTEGDYYRMYIDFGPTVLTGDMESTTQFAVCINQDAEGNKDTQALYFVGSAEAVIYTGEPGYYGISVDEEKNLWTFEGKLPWSDLLGLFEKNSGVKITPAAGLTATALVMYVDFGEGYRQTGWFGSTITGYEAAAWFGPEEYGINMIFVGENDEIPARPETTFPDTEPTPDTETDTIAPDTAAPDTSDSETKAPDTSLRETDDDVVTTKAPVTDPETPKGDEGGLPTGAIIGIVTGAVVIIAVVAVAVLKKKS